MNRNFGATIKISLALMLSLFTSSFMPAYTVYATQPGGQDNNAGGGNIDCPTGTTLLAKYNLSGGNYVAESGGGDVTVTGNATSGSFTVVKANTTVSAVVVKGSTDTKTTPYSPSVTMGTFDNVGLTNLPGNTPGISNVKICGTTVIPPQNTPVSANVTFNDPCGTTNDTYTLTTTTGVTYTVNGVVVTTSGPHTASGTVNVVATAQAGYVLTGGATFDKTFNDEPCDVDDTPVTAGLVTVTEKCATADDKLIIPTTAGVTYSIGGVTIAAGTHSGVGSVTAVATADAGFVLTAPYSFTHTFTNDACEIEGDDDEKVTLCHATGSESNLFVLIEIAAAGAFNGHLGDDHQDGEDIIPPFTFDGMVYSQNWDAEGMAIFDNDCVVPDEEEPVPPVTPVVLVVSLPCVTPGTSSGMITARVTNPNADIDFALDLYNASDVLVDTKEIMVAADTSQEVTFSGLAAGAYSIDLLASDGADYEFLSTTSVTLANCVVVPGQILGSSTTSRTTTNQVTSGKVLSTSLPAQLPATGNEANVNLLYGIFAAIATYGAAYFLQGRRNLSSL